MIEEYRNIITNLTISEWTLLVAFLAIFILRFTYLFLFTGRLSFSKKKNPGNEKKQAVSVIFTFRNEEQNVKKNLPQLLEFKGLDYEVVAVDDYSQDNTLSLLGLFKQRYGHLKISSLSQETRFSNKLAQNIALKSASNDWVFVVPIAMEDISNDWLLNAAAQLANSSKNLMLSYSNASIKKGVYNLLYRIEHFFQQLTSAAYIYNGIPFIYSEDNIAFKKEKYFELGGYGKNIKEPYANLELLVNSFIKKKSTLLNFAAETSIKKELEIGRAEYKDLLNKSIRIENYLPLWKKIFLFTDRFTELLFLPLLTLCLVFSFQLILLIYIPVAVLFVAKVLIIKITLNRLNERKIFISSLVYGLLMPYYKMIYRWRFGKTSRKNRWNKVV